VAKMSLFPTGLRKKDIEFLPPNKTSKRVKLENALIALVELCEKETHANSGTVVFSKYRKEYTAAKSLVKKLKRNIKP
jgi:hypothetical protein